MLKHGPRLSIPGDASLELLKILWFSCWRSDCKTCGMTRRFRFLSSNVTPFVAVVLSATVAAAQTPIELRKNRFSPADDVKLGQQAAKEIRQQMPLLADEPTEAFLERIGERLIDEIPSD